ncbi:MAG: HlyC/CorC family transporter [Candidatus Mcinerneyibacterium aminivorans]|jgi:CBS domain containing-hemolysin-like protein|uniref:HlyC/CorC family transporter n=1 Tax=Candidatus Mcinerneyibacterium aminivorans TaxID=2703815 RepID=A0A5D0MIH2_9BACT|nr:MAG: HlyC/CorC family transporter [Candidatus Mcinerneyibacterium aminivorans]
MYLYYFGLIVSITIVFILKFIESFLAGFTYNKIRNILFKKEKIRKLMVKWLEKRDILLASLHFTKYLFLLLIFSNVYFVTGKNFVMTLLYTFLIFVCMGEYLPRSLAMQGKLIYFYYLLKPLYYILYLFFPLVRLLLIPIDLILKIFGGKRVLQTSYFGKFEDEVIKKILKEGNLQERKMISSVLEFKDIVAKEIMVPRVDIVAVPVDINYTELVDLIEEKGHSRLPVYDERLDEILGIIYVKDLIKIDKETFNPRKLLRKTFFVPETRKINQLLRDFQSKHKHIAFVVDEYGDLSGLVTIEDVLEEIVGEIEDEYDVEEVLYTELSQKEYVISSKMTIEEFKETFGIKLDKYIREEADYETLAGFIISKLGVLPQKGQKLEYEKFSFKIIEANERRIKKILLTVKTKGENIEN